VKKQWNLPYPKPQAPPNIQTFPKKLIDQKPNNNHDPKNLTHTKIQTQKKSNKRPKIGATEDQK
jgi:hypothetical protein